LQYQEFKPTAPLASFVECFWHLQTGAAEMPVQRVVPDGRMEIVIHLGEPFSHSKGASTERQRRVMISGQLTRAILLTPSRGGRVFGVRFKPAGASALLQSPMSELTDELLPLDDVSPGLQRELMDAAERSATGSYTSTQIVNDISDVLGAHARDSAPSTQLNAVVSAILNSHGEVSVAAVARECNVSERQLERLFRERVGVSPKMLSRLARFQRALAGFDGESNWADVAAEAGYYDQSHLLHDFRRFAGETPTFLVSPTTDLAEHFTARK
jgi:AraC-like DNA-binding protein